MINYILLFFCDVVLGREFQSRHLKVTFEYGDQLPEFVVKSSGTYFALEAVNITELALFSAISTKSKATKSRSFNKEDSVFMAMEIGKLQEDGITEHSMSPCRAQIVVVKNETNKQTNRKTKTKKRLCVDYSQTMNIYIELDAFS